MSANEQYLILHRQSRKNKRERRDQFAHLVDTLVRPKLVRYDQDYNQYEKEAFRLLAQNGVKIGASYIVPNIKVMFNHANYGCIERFPEDCRRFPLTIIIVQISVFENYEQFRLEINKDIRYMWFNLVEIMPLLIAEAIKG